MYCRLCNTEASATHSSSTGHHAAQKLVAEALDRLANLTESGDSTEGSTNVSGNTEKEGKTPEAVSYCDTCNSVYPINEQPSHYRQKKHAMALLSGQEFEELVQAYIGGEINLEATSEASDDVEFVDEAEAVKTYTCHLCALEVPSVFRAEHERNSRHRASRTFALAVARRARDVFSPPDGSEDGSGDNKFNSKMMRKLLKAYTRRLDDVENVEEPEPKKEQVLKTEPKLTPKQYFSEIIPFLPYIGTFNTLYIDNTEFVTLKIGNETLKIHVNNLNGLYNIDGNDGYYMRCRLCDGSSNMYYSSMGQCDKMHVMTLGHIRNLLSPFDNIHLIRKIDTTHYICGLCNNHIFPNTHSVENHIFKDAQHTMALTEALERGKDFKETEDQLRIMLHMPPVPKPSVFQTNQVNNKNKWMFGIPQQKYLFGAQNTGFGTTQSNNTFGGQNAAFGTVQNAGFGNAITQNAGFGSPSTQNAGFGSTQPSCFGSSAQSKTSLFGAAQKNATGFGATQNNATVFCATQNNATGFGAAQNNATGFGVSQNSATGFGSTQNNGTSLGVTQNTATGFGATQMNATVFGAAQNNAAGFGAAQNNAPVFGVAQNNTTGFGATQTNDNSFGATQNNINSVGAAHKSASVFGAPQNNTTSVGAAHKSASVFGAPQNNTTSVGAAHKSASVFGAAQNNTTSVGAAHKSASVFGAAQNNTTSGGAAHKTASVFGADQNNATGADQNNATGFGAAQNNATVSGAAKLNSPSFSASSKNSTAFPVAPNTIDESTQKNAPRIAESLNASDFGAAEYKAAKFGVSKNNVSLGGSPNNTLDFSVAKKGVATLSTDVNQKGTNTGPVKKASFSFDTQNNPTSIQKTEENKRNIAEVQKKNIFYKTGLDIPGINFNFTDARKLETGNPQNKVIGDKNQIKLTDESNIQKAKSSSRKLNYSSSSSDSD